MSPQFFQPVLLGFLSNFPIPKSFLKYLDLDEGEDDEKIATLRDMRGRIWKVKIATEGYFEDGWHKFSKDHELNLGDFLVFRYEGNMVFDVTIFDPSTGCEREFPVSDPLPKPNLNACSSNHPTKSSIHPTRSGIFLPTKSGIHKKGKDLKRTRGPKVNAPAKFAFKSEHPFFHVMLRPYMIKWGGMPIPAKFARDHGLTRRWSEIKLTDDKGQSWKLPLRYSDNFIKSATTTFIGAWGPFQEARGLKVGDSVVFELLASGEKPVLKFSKLN